MFDLKSILKDIGAKEKTERKDALIAAVEEHKTWTTADRTEEVASLQMTRYELFWLSWRIRVHLRSYENFEWSEMKDVLTTLLKRLEKEDERCLSTVVPNVKESSVNGMPITVDFALTSPGL